MSWLAVGGVAYLIGYAMGKTDGYLAGLKKANEILNEW